MKSKASRTLLDRRVFDALREALVVADINTGMVVDANRAAESLYGWSIAELRSLHYSQLYPPGIVQRAGTGSDVAGITEGLVLHKDGHQIPVQIEVSHFTDDDGTRLLIGTFRDCTECSAIRDANGTLLGYRGARRDITERKQAEAELLKRERIYRAIGESIDYGVWVCTPDGRNTYVSESFLKLLGLTQEQCSDFGWGDILHPDDAERTLAAWRECVRTEGRWDVEHRYRDADGEWHPILSRGVPVRDEHGRITCWAGINLDISTVKRTEERLRESESQARARTAQLQAIMDAAPAAIFVAHDPECQHITGNRMAEALVRQPRGSNLSIEPFGEKRRDFRVMRDGVEVPIPELPVQAAARTGMPLRNCEVEVVFEDGTSVYVLGNAEPMLDDTCRPRGAVAVLSDITEHKRAEAALREKEDQFRHMAETAPVMFWASDADNLGTFFNERWLDFTGRTLEQELGDGWTSSVHPDDMDRSITVCTAALKARRSFQTLFRLRRADGEYRWVLDSGVPRYRDGEFNGFIGSCIDVTEQKTIEDRLRANEARLKDAQRFAQIGSWELDLASGKADWSDEMFRIFGLPNGAPPDFSSFPSYVHPKDREIFLKAREQAAASTAPVQVEFRIIRPNGDVRVVRTSGEAIKDDQGTPIRLVGATQDITEQVNATELLRESEKRLRNAERIAHVGNWRWDIKADQISCSQELCRIFGTTPNWTPDYEQFIGRVARQDKERVDQWMKDCLAGKTENSIEFQIGRTNGELRTVVFVNEVSWDETDSPLHMYGTCQDVTEARRAQVEAFARQKLESLGTMANGIAHDFNNLLGAVLAQAELALAELADGSNPEKPLNDIRSAALRGAEIVRQLMIYSGKENAEPGPVDLSQTVADMLELLKISVSKHAVLQTDLASGLPPVRASASQVRQILMNLVTNASEAIKNEDAIIRVATRRVQIDAADLAPQAAGVSHGEFLQLEVTDTGCGMTTETQAKVFEPFYTTKSAGHGLGLAVVHGIVRGLGGTIQLVSELGTGSTFIVTLPIVENATPGTRQVQSGDGELPASRLESGTVLVVEDEDVLRHAVAAMLRRQGFDVLEAADGTASLNILRQANRRIDVILLDMTIPGHSSQDVVAEAVQSQPTTKVLLTSAHAEEMVRAAVSGPPIRGFVRKPFRLADLVQSIRNLVSS